MPDLVKTLSHDSLSPFKLLETELTEKTKRFGLFDSRTTDSRAQLQDSYKTLLIQDFNVVQGSDAESIVWKEIYRVIEEYRRRISQSVAQASKKPEEHAQLLRDFSTFLIDSSGFYIKLIKGLDQEYGLSVLEHVNQIQEPLFGLNVEFGPTAPNNVELRLLLKCYQKILIFLGDLARYHELHKIEKSPKKWNVARLYYKCAISLLHTQGNPYNQLAVVSSYERDELAAIYYYYRSLMIPQPFPNAKNNLELTMSQLLKTGSQLQDLPTNISNKTLFFKYFLFSHATLFKTQELDSFLTFKPTVISTFKALIRKRELSLEQNLMITSINLASFEYLMYFCKDSSSKSLYQRNAVIFSIDIFEAFLENGIDALDKLSFHRRRQEFLYESLPSGLKRTLPAIYVYIYWAKRNIDFIRTSLSSGTLEELGGELCHDSFWRKLKTFTQGLRKIKKKVRHQPSPVILEEEIELSGQLFGKTPFSIPSRVLLQEFSKVKNEAQAGWRICKLLSAATNITRFNNDHSKAPVVEDTTIENEDVAHDEDSASKDESDDPASDPAVAEEIEEHELAEDVTGVVESSDEDNFVFKGRVIPDTPPSPQVSSHNESSPILEPIASTQHPHELRNLTEESSNKNEAYSNSVPTFLRSPDFKNGENRSQSPTPFTQSLESYVDKLVGDTEFTKPIQMESPVTGFAPGSSYPAPPFQYSQFNSFCSPAPSGLFPYNQPGAPIPRNSSSVSHLGSYNDIWAPPGANHPSNHPQAFGQEAKVDKARRVSDSSYLGNPGFFSTPQTVPFEPRHSFATPARPPPPGFAPPMPHGMNMATGSRHSYNHPYKPTNQGGDDVASSSFNHLFNNETYQGFLGR